MTNYIKGPIAINELTVPSRDLLEACPRRGGYVKIINRGRPAGGVNWKPNSKVTKELFKKQSCISSDSTLYHCPTLTTFGHNDVELYLHSCSEMSRTHVESGDWNKATYEEDKNKIGVFLNVEEDSHSMLAVTISLIMILASGVQNIPEEYFIWAQSYLGCIKNELGQYPPNVMGLLRLIHETQFCDTAKSSTTTVSSKTGKIKTTVKNGKVQNVRSSYIVPKRIFGADKLGEKKWKKTNP